MPKIVELPDGKRVEFPDSMDDQAISAAIQKQLGNPARAKRQEMRAMGAGDPSKMRTPMSEGREGSVSDLVGPGVAALTGLGGAEQASKGGVANVIHGTVKALAPTSLPVGIVEAPLATLAATLGGSVGEGVGQAGSKALGASDEESEAMGAIAGLMGGGLAASKMPTPNIGGLVNAGKGSMGKLIEFAKKDPELARDLIGLASPRAAHAVGVGQKGVRVAGKISDLMAARGKPSPVEHQAPEVPPMVGKVPPSSGAPPVPKAPVNPDPEKAEMADIMRRVIEMKPGSNPIKKEGAPDRFDQGSGPVIRPPKSKIVTGLPEGHPLLRPENAELLAELLKAAPAMAGKGKVK